MSCCQTWASGSCKDVRWNNEQDILFSSVWQLAAIIRLGKMQLIAMTAIQFNFAEDLFAHGIMERISLRRPPPMCRILIVQPNKSYAQNIITTNLTSSVSYGTSANVSWGARWSLQRQSAWNLPKQSAWNIYIRSGTVTIASCRWHNVTVYCVD